MEIRLLVKKGRTTANQLSIRKFPTVIGRHRECNLRIASRQVSRRHCVLKTRDGWLIVCDLDSCNGTLVNGHHARGERVLHPGDVIEIGPITFEVSYIPPVSPPVPEEASDTLVLSQSTAFEEAAPDPSDNAYELSERLAEFEKGNLDSVGQDTKTDVPSASDSDSKIIVMDEEAANISPTKRLFSREASEADTVHQRH